MKTILAPWITCALLLLVVAPAWGEKGAPADAEAAFFASLAKPPAATAAASGDGKPMPSTPFVTSAVPPCCQGCLDEAAECVRTCGDTLSCLVLSCAGPYFSCVLLHCPIQEAQLCPVIGG